MVDANGQAIVDHAQAAFALMVKYVMPVGVRGLSLRGCWRRSCARWPGPSTPAPRCSRLISTKTQAAGDPGSTRLGWTDRDLVMVLIGLL